MGQEVFRDNGSHISLKRGVSNAGIKSTLCIAMAKFNGQPLTVNGSDAFKERCIEVAAKEKLPITFSNPSIEQERMSRLQQLYAKDEKLMPAVPSRRSSRESVGLIRKKSSGMTR